jgi:hypothetical protein
MDSGYRVLIQGALFLEEQAGVWENVIDGVTWRFTGTDFGPNGEKPTWSLETLDGSYKGSGNTMVSLLGILRAYKIGIYGREDI